MKITLIKVSI